MGESGLKGWAQENRGRAVGVLGALWAIGTAGVGFGIVRAYYERECLLENPRADCSAAGDGAMWAVFLVVTAIALVCLAVIFAADE